MVNRAFGEAAADGQPGVAGPDHDDRGAMHERSAMPRSGQLDEHPGWVCDHVVDGRALLRLGNNRFEVLAGSVSVDVEANAHALEAVADARVGAEDAEDVHGGFRP